jgi:hypothetical protein
MLYRVHNFCYRDQFLVAQLHNNSVKLMHNFQRFFESMILMSVCWVRIVKNIEADISGCVLCR